MSYAIANLLMNIISLYIFVIFAWVVVSWLQAFGIINVRNPLGRNIVAVLNALVEPVARPIRKIIPAVGGLDLSPIILLFGLYFLRDFIFNFARTGSLL